MGIFVVNPLGRGGHEFRDYNPDAVLRGEVHHAVVIGPIVFAGREFPCTGGAERPQHRLYFSREPQGQGALRAICTFEANSGPFCTFEANSGDAPGIGAKSALLISISDSLAAIL